MRRISASISYHAQGGIALKKPGLMMASLGLTLAMWSSTLLAAEPCAEPVSTRQGIYSGAKDPGFDSCVYKGIPFALAPVGELRFARPLPPSSHQGVVQALKFGPACPQKEDITMGGKAESYSEDCLNLNVWRPAKSGS
jgi:para-nitrobenzyl esterase